MSKLGKFGPGLPRLVTSWSSRRMPQVNNPQVRRDMELSPVGPGTVFSRLVQMSKTTRERANLINKTEEARLQKIEKIIEKEHRFQNNLQNKVIERTSKTLKEKQALLKILGNEYRVDNFVTMQKGFDPNQIDTRSIARRYVMESRILTTGFNVKALKPEVNRQLRKLDPNHKYRTFKKRLLANCKEQNVEINRAMGETTFYEMLHDKEHWREYNNPIKTANRRNLVSTPTVDQSKRQLSSREQPHVHAEPVNEDKSERDTTVQKDGAEEEVKERSIVLERRLPRRPQQAFGMTMRTLGPVYFQSSVNNLANPDAGAIGAT